MRIKKISKLLGFLVSCFLVCWFLGFKVSKFLGFAACWFLGFQVSKFLRFKSLILYYQIVIAGFLEDINPICRVSKEVLDGSSGFVAPSPFLEISKSDFQPSEISQNNVFENDSGLFLNYLEDLGVSEDK